MLHRYFYQFWAVLLLCIVGHKSHGQTVLSPGDLVITGANSTDLSAADPDNFSFAPLVDLAAGTQIIFTDNGWQAAGGFRSTEGTATYTAPAGGVPKGRIVTFSTGNHPDFTATGTFLLATDGDQILAYQGTNTSPRFIYGLTLRKPWSDATSSNTSAVPAGLQNGVTAVAAPWCNAYMYQPAMRRGLTAVVRSNFTKASNWTGNNQSRVTWPTTDLILEGLVLDATELQALQAFYTSTGGANWANQTNWPSTSTWPATLSNIDFATWFGVGVSNGDVTSLSFNNNRLNGLIPEALSQLTLLRELRLNQNTLSGYVPQSLAQLPLQVLTVANNKLSSIPDFSRMAASRLATLTVDASNNVILFGPLEANFDPTSGRKLPFAYSWLYQPQPYGEDTETQNIGEPITLTCSFSGAHNVYQWGKGTGNAWTPITGATAATYRINSSVAGNAGQYACKVTNTVVTGLELWTRTTTIVLRTGAAQATTPPNTPDANLSRNWTIERTYDGEGNAVSNILAESKQFTDALGRSTQVQARSRANEHVFASEAIYDKAGQPVLQTLAAPINNQSFAYKEKFTAITDGLGNTVEYGSANFEDTPTGAPTGLDVKDPGTLGYYYSTANELEPLTPATAFPFSLTVPTKDPLGGLQRAGGPGEAFRVGSGHEVKGHEIPLLKEFDNYVALRHHFVAGNYLVTLQRQGTKTIGVDADGRESVAVTNKEGQTLVSCLTGTQYKPTEVTGFVSTHPDAAHDATAPRFLDIHIPATGEHEVKFMLGGQVRVKNLNNKAGGVRLAGSSAYLDSADVTLNQGAASVFLQPGFYRLISRPSDVVADQNQQFTYSAEYGNFSYTYYDDAGRAVATVAPNGLDNRNTTAISSGSGPDLVGAWSFDEGSGNTTSDKSGNGLSATFGPFTWSTPAVPAGIPPSPAGGSSLIFDGNNYVAIGDAVGLRMSNTVSFEAWIYPTSNQNGIILNKENEYEMARFPDGSIQWAFRNTSPGWNWVSTGIIAPLNTWSHIALTYNNGVVTPYFNGVQAGQVYLGAGPIQYMGGSLWLGDRQATRQPFVGAMDEVRIYNTVHPPARTAALPTAVIQPQFVTRNTYDTSSQLLASESNDEGRSEYVYARDGRIRFSQSALQRSAGRFSYSNYDEQGRVVESGEYSSTQDVVFQSQLPLRTIFEAEDASYISSDVSNFYAGAHGTQRKYVQNLNVAPPSGAVYGSAVQFSVTGVPSAGTYPVNLRYSAGFGSTRTMSVWANGAKVQQVFFPATGGWDVWDVVTVALPLRAGANVISVQYETDDNGAINLDYLEVVAEQTASSTSVLNLLEERAPTNSLLAANCRQRSFVTYDEVFTAAGTNPEPLLTGRTQEFTNGAVTKTSNDKVTTWYSYDELGRVTWMVQNITGVGAKTLDYTYDLAGNVLEVAYQQGQPDAFHHYYEYDQAQRLYKVYTSPDGTSRTLQAKYVYYLHGPLKRVELANGLQGVDYTYTLQGWLKGINHVNGRLDPGSDSPTNNGVAKDLFGLTLDYFSGDYQSRIQPALNLAGASSPASPFRYDGTIRTASWRAGAAPAHQSGYDYDVKSQLSESAFGELAIAGAPKASTYQVTPTQNYKEGGLGYDLNGNIQSLRRTNQNGQTTDNFRYEYTAGTNRLAAVHGGGSASGTTVMDYDYDAVGQMTRQRDEQGQRYYTYDVTGKTTGVYLDAARTQPVVEFAYDDRGFRVSKKSYGTGFDAGHTNTTYYVRDAGGNVLSVYKQGWQTGNLLQRSEAPLYGAGRIGVLTRLDDSTAVSTDDARYELNDHLGNARVVFHRPTTVTTTASCELTNGQEDSQWLGMAQARQYAGAGAHQGVTTPSVYVAHLAPPAARGSTEGPYHNAYVERGDTLTFSAWIRLEPIPIIVGGGDGRRLHLMPVLTTTPETSPTTDAGLTTRPSLFNRITGGIALIGWGGSKSIVPPTVSRPGGTSTRVWIRYRVFDENQNQVDEQYTYLDNATAYTWQQLQTAVRVQQGGRVEVAVGTDDPGYDVAFDDLRLEQTGGLIVQEQHQYAYGSPLVGLNYAVGNKRYRYGYQGQFAEKDAETGFESFELRLYNDRIGRWTSNDPYGQFSSPYVAMGNNPVSRTDSKGGWSELSGALWGAGIGAAAGLTIGITSGGRDGWWVGALSGAVAGASIGGFIGYMSENYGTIFKAGEAARCSMSAEELLAPSVIQTTKAGGLSFMAGGINVTRSAYNGALTQASVGQQLVISGNAPNTNWLQVVKTNRPKYPQYVTSDAWSVDRNNQSGFWHSQNGTPFTDTATKVASMHTSNGSPFNEQMFPDLQEAHFEAYVSEVVPGDFGEYKILRTIQWSYSWESVTGIVKTQRIRFHPMPAKAKAALNNYLMKYGTF